jgi:hypothetical protein
VEVGLRADLVLARLDAAGLPQVEATYRGGRLVHAFTNGNVLEPAVSGAGKLSVSAGERG